MAVDAKRLTKDWIQYLKNNRIVGMQSDPNTGKLSYKRKVTTDDVSKFLEVKGEFDEGAISNAIHMVLAKQAMAASSPKLQNNPSPKAPGNALSTWHHDETRPGTRSDQNTTHHAVDIGPDRIRHDPGNVSDIDYKDIPDSRGADSKFKKRKFNEAFTDEEGYTVSEEEVEQIFNILANAPASTESEPESDEQPAEPEEAEDDPQERVDNINRLKSLIRDKMSDAQRKALWGALSDA